MRAAPVFDLQGKDMDAGLGALAADKAAALVPDVTVGLANVFNKSNAGGVRTELVKGVVFEVGPPGQDWLGYLHDLVLSQDGVGAGGEDSQPLHFARSYALVLLYDGPVIETALLAVHRAGRGGRGILLQHLCSLFELGVSSFILRLSIFVSLDGFNQVIGQLKKSKLAAKLRYDKKNTYQLVELLESKFSVVAKLFALED